MAESRPIGPVNEHAISLFRMVRHLGRGDLHRYIAIAALKFAKEFSGRPENRSRCRAR